MYPRTVRRKRPPGPAAWIVKFVTTLMLVSAAADVQSVRGQDLVKLLEAIFEPQKAVAPALTLDAPRAVGSDAQRAPDDLRYELAEVRSSIEDTIDIQPANAAGDAAMAMEIANIEQQFIGQFRNIMKSELYFAKTTCQLTKEQYKALAARGERAMRQATRRFADVQRKMMRGQFIPGQDSSYPDPRAIIGEAFASSLKKLVSSEQYAKYDSELAKRIEFRKRTAIRNLVFRLDNQLVLSDEQRSLISSDLDKNWREAWGNQLEYLMYDQFNNQLPDESIVPHLNEQQKVVWNLSRSNGQVNFGWGGFGVMMGENFWDDGAIEVNGAVQLGPEPLENEGGEALMDAQGRVMAVFAAPAAPVEVQVEDGPDFIIEVDDEPAADSGAKPAPPEVVPGQVEPPTAEPPKPEPQQREEP